MREGVVYADEGGRDVGLLVDVGEAEAREERGAVEDCGVIFRGEACAEGVACLSTFVVYAVD